MIHFLCSVSSFWRGYSLADLDNLPDPDVLTADIIENLQSAMDSFQELMATLKKEKKQNNYTPPGACAPGGV